MMQFLEDPKNWVAISFALFLVFFGSKLWKGMAGSLDAKRARIATELETARALREEAEQVLESYKRQQAESLKEAEAIITRAREDAEKMARAAQAELQATLENRTRLAKEKISQAEKQAIDDVRAHVADITIAAAKALLMQELKDIPSDELVRAAIADIERKVH